MPLAYSASMSNRRSMLFMTGAHRALQRWSFGRLGWSLGSLPVIELTTIGRRSGQPRSTLLTTPVVETVDGVERLIVVASRGGDDAYPAWYLNLVDHPDVTVQGRHGTALAYRARVADDTERERLWRLAVAAYGGYAAYQRKTARRIPIVILEPAGTNA